MGGTAGVFVKDAMKELFESSIGKFGKFLTDETGVYGLARSGEALLRDSGPAGNILADHIMYNFEPAVKRTGQRLLDTKLQPGMTPSQATAAIHKLGEDTLILNRDLYFGKNREFVIKAIGEIAKSHGPTRAEAAADIMNMYMRDTTNHWRTKKVGFITPGARLSLVDIGVSPKVRYVSPAEWEMNLRQSTAPLFTQTIAIPHLGQIVNPMLRETIPATAKALSEWTKVLVRSGRPDRAFRDVIESGVLFDEFRYQALSDAKTPGASFADKIYHSPAFNWLRRQQITISALAAKNNALRAVDELRNGIDVKWNEHTLQRLGIDVNNLRQKGFQVSADDIQSALFQGGAQNMFIRSELEIPWKWEENWGGRLGSMFRTFGFRQGKFLGEAFIDAWKYGGAKQLAKTIGVFATLFPAAGELVRQLESIAAGKGYDDPFGDKAPSASLRWLQDLGYVGGLGIYSSMFKAGQRGYIKGAFEGPIFSTAEDFFRGGIDIKDGLMYEYEGEPDKATRKFKAAGRLTIGRLGAPGRVIANTLLKKDEEEP